MNSPESLGGGAGDFKNRKTGLMIFGTLTILLGGLCALFVPLMLFGQQMAVQTGSAQSNQTILPAVLMYAVLAIILVWLGIGSIMARRWARALLLIFSSTWLVIGTFGTIVMAFVMPKLMASIRAETAPPPGGAEMPSWAGSVMVLLPMLIVGVVYVIVPLGWVLFYRSKHVKATCQAFDPVERWTDRCPLAVLALSLLLACSAPMMFVMPFVYNGVLPFFGSFLTGAVGSAACILLGLLWLYLARALYRLDRQGWWIAVGSFTLISISTVITYLRHDLADVYVLMGYPAEEIAQIEKYSFISDSSMVAMTAVGCVLWLAYLVYLRKFFAFGRPEADKSPA